MKIAKLLMALLAACLLTIPAFSMPNSENQQMNSQGQQPMSDTGKLLDPCDCKAPEIPTGPNEKTCPKSMMDGKLAGPAPMGENGNPGHKDNCAPKSMMDGKMPLPCDRKATQVHNENAGQKSMMENDLPRDGLQAQGKR
jgi:hypothetical protein